MREVIRTLKAMLSEGQFPVSDGVNCLSAVQWALNTGYWEWYNNTPYHIMYGQEPRTALSAVKN
ncbi:unnamed protein product, partial [Choristocarpus tenellus]